MRKNLEVRKTFLLFCFEILFKPFRNVSSPKFFSNFWFWTKPFLEFNSNGVKCEKISEVRKYPDMIGCSGINVGHRKSDDLNENMYVGVFEDEKNVVRT